MPPKKILVIDDDDNFRSFIREICHGRGYDVREAANGKEALERLAAQVPDLVFMDVMMPDTDGVSLCREVRLIEATKDVPILMVSALADTATLRDALAFGATDYLVKPVDLPRLLAKIEELLGESPRRKK